MQNTLTLGLVASEKKIVKFDNFGRASYKKRLCQVYSNFKIGYGGDLV